MVSVSTHESPPRRAAVRAALTTRSLAGNAFLGRVSSVDWGHAAPHRHRTRFVQGHRLRG
ncbi:hypothetical protein ACFPRL_09345 [Pseudoclavibacter helvolus]